MKEWKKGIIIIGVFFAAYFLPFSNTHISNAILEAFLMLQNYAKEHVLLSLIPAFFIAGAVSVFLSQGSIIKYLGAKTNKIVAYSMASISGTILAVCSCTVLPLFSGIYKRGAGIGPATTFLYSGPAINILAIILTTKILGPEMGIARAVGAMVFSIVIGLLMNIIFMKDEEEKTEKTTMFIQEDKKSRSLLQTGLFFFSLIAILFFLNVGKNESILIWNNIYLFKYYIVGGFLLALLTMIIRWFKKEELQHWVISSKNLTLQILPLLFGGILFAGFFFGRPESNGIIDKAWVTTLVGGNSLFSNFFASITGAFMYFATLTEIPILQGLLYAGMGKGPALTLLLAGPALSLPNMLVIRSVLGTKKTIVYITLVIILATLSGWLFGKMIQ